MTNAAELLRLIHNLIRLGTIVQVDSARAKVRVQTGDITTNWLPWIESRSGTTRTWNPPTPGEQCAMFSPGGDLSAAVVLTGLYRNQHPAPSDNPDVWNLTLPDGAVIEYDHAASHLQATLPGSATIDAQGAVKVTTAGTLTATAAGGATINANTVINGTLAVNGGSLTHNGKNVGDDHQHSGISTGTSNTGAPV